MSDTMLDVRKRALEEAAVEICGYCRGLSSGFDPVPVQRYGIYIHLLIKGNGYNVCASGKIWAMVAEAKMERELASAAVQQSREGEE